jgi:hypothetical protein
MIEHPSHNIIDSTKLKAFQECPRMYFYEYVLGWRSEYPNLHLEFGKAWHYAMEHLLLHGYEAKSVSEAWNLLNEHYRRFFSIEMDEGNAPKNPSNALTALMAYVREYERVDREQKVLHTEIAGTVALDDHRLLHFRMDSILEVDNMIRSREHKTGSTVSRSWTDQWSLAVQTWTYNHVLYSLFPKDIVWGVEINGTFLQKKENKFLRVPARRSLQMMEAGFWNILHWFYEIETEMERLSECKEADKVMMCFPMNPSHCTSYFGCKYMDYCLAWPNPLQRCDEVPMGLKREFWNPQDEESKVVFNVGGTVV